MGDIALLFATIKKELMVFFAASLPVSELKGAIPIGVGLGIRPLITFILAYFGSLLPVPFLLYFLKPVMAFLKSTKLFKPFAHWVEDRAHRKGQTVRKYSLLGLFIFVAIPLPTTGVWTGSAIASFLDLRIKHAFPIIALGNLLAGLIVVFITKQVTLI